MFFLLYIFIEKTFCLLADFILDRLNFRLNLKIEFNHVIADSFEKDVGTLTFNDWKASRQTSASYQRFDKTASAVLDMLKYVSKSMKNVGYSKPMILMSGVAGEGDAILAGMQTGAV